MNDFHETFDVKNVSTALNQEKIQLLAEACLVLSILEPKYKKELLNWFVDSELSEYKALFQENQDIAWLDKIDKRFSWLKKHLIVFEEKIGFLFPPSWEVSECISVEFCKITRKELIKVMNNRFIELNVDILLPAISKATAFEKLLSQRFTGVTLKNDKSINKNRFIGLITICFENYLNIYVEAQDKNFEKMIEQFIDEHNKSNQQTQDKAEIFATSGKLFTQYKNCLIQCLSLSNRQPLVLLSNTFQKYLREYAHKILQNNIPRVGSNLSIGSISNTISSSSGGVLSAATSAAGLIQIFLKDLENKSYSLTEIIQVCSIILTANYCLETSQQLEKKIQEKVEPTFIEKINMSSECDIFHGLVFIFLFQRITFLFRIITNCIQLLTHSIEYSCEQPLNTMVKVRIIIRKRDCNQRIFQTQWSNIGTPIGHSQYVSSLISTFHQLFPVIRDNLSDISSQYHNFCTKFASNFISKFVSNLYKCKPLSQGGAEQLLLDCHTLKKILLELPECKSLAKNSIPQSYISTVISGMTKAEMILKIVLVSSAPPEMFVENYFKLFQEKDIVEFQKVLEMKGIKKSESTHILDLFRRTKLVNKPTVNKLNGDESSADDAELVNTIDSSRIKRLEKLIKKKL